MKVDQFTRLQRLCKLESGHEPSSSSDALYVEWLKTKRPFTRDEVVGAYMLKLGEECGGYLVRFNADGTSTERFAFKPEKSWTCHWDLDADGVIHLTCPSQSPQGDPVSCYLDIVASHEGTMHAGCEQNTHDRDLVEHFKVLYLGHTIVMPGMS